MVAHAMLMAAAQRHDVSVALLGRATAAWLKAEHAESQPLPPFSPQASKAAHTRDTDEDGGLGVRAVVPDHPGVARDRRALPSAHEEGDERLGSPDATALVRTEHVCS